MPSWLNKNIIQAMSDRDRLKKQRMFTEYKAARKKGCCFFWSEMQRNYISGDLWKATKMYRQFGAL